MVDLRVTLRAHSDSSRRFLITAEARLASLGDRVAVLRALEPSADTATGESVEAFIEAIAALFEECGDDVARLDAQDEIFLREASGRQISNVGAILKRDRHLAFDILMRLFQVGV